MTGYQSKKKAASAKTIDQVNWADHEPDGLVHTAQPHCQCSACKDGKLHLSDCAVHNEPAYPAGPCDCGVLNQQIAQPAQEFKTWAGVDFDIHTTPPQRPWVGLTPEELNMIGDSMRTWNSWSITDVYTAIEAKLKEKNNGT